MTCPSCADVLPLLAPGESVRCTYCGAGQTAPAQGSDEAPRHPRRHRERPALTGSAGASAALRRTLADLDTVERWEARARYGSTLELMQRGVQTDLDEPEDVAWGSLNRDERDTILARLASSVGPRREALEEPDWTRARELQRHLRELECDPATVRAGAVLRFLQSHATAADCATPEALQVRVAWSFARPDARERWRKAGYVPPGERGKVVKRRRGGPGQRATELETPQGWGRSLVSGAVLAWTGCEGE